MVLENQQLEWISKGREEITFDNFAISFLEGSILKDSVYSKPIPIALLEFRVKGSMTKTDATNYHYNLNDCYQQYCNSLLEAKTKPAAL